MPGDTCPLSPVWTGGIGSSACRDASPDAIVLAAISSLIRRFCSCLRSASSISPRVYLILSNRILLSMSNLSLHFSTYMALLTASGTSATVSAMSFIRSAFLIGSSPASASRMSVLNVMKSCSCDSKKAVTSSKVCLRENESGSSPSGRSTTFTFIPSLSTRPIPRSAALIPAESPSYMMQILSVNFLMSLICSTVRDVPLDATTLVMPSWCIEITSK